MLATAVPGLAPLVARSLSAAPGVEVTGTGFDGRSDLLLLEVDRDGRATLLGSPLTEDVFVEVGRADRAGGDDPGSLAGRLWRPERVERALSLYAEQVRPLRGSMTFRVVARVLQERSFLRTELRQAMARAVQRQRSRWRPADPAQVEVWVAEHAPGQFVAGIRLTDARMRQHGGRQAERHGALRPTVAATMVQLAGPPEGTLLDPCCGTGTIVAEALAAGWQARGIDIDPEAVEVARRNLPPGTVTEGDARALPLAGGIVTACVTNLPFGQQFSVQGGMDGWLASVLDELARVTRPGGRIVLLAPRLPSDRVPATLRLDTRHPIRLLGTQTTIWALDRLPE